MAKAARSKAHDPDEWVSIKIPPNARALVEELLKRASADGWRSLGITDRTESPTRGGLIEAGLAQLGALGPALAAMTAARNEAVQIGRHYAKEAGFDDDIKRLDAIAEVGQA